MGLNPFKNEDKRWGAQGLLTPVDSGLRTISMTFSDYSDAVSLSSEERQAISDAQRGNPTKLNASKQKGLANKLKAAKAKHDKKKAENELIKKAKEREKRDKYLNGKRK